MLDRKQASPIRSPCQLPINRSGINPPKVDKIGATTERCQAAWLALRKRQCFYRQRMNLSGELGNSSSPSRAEGLNLTRTMNRRHTDRSCDSHEDLNDTELISAVCFFSKFSREEFEGVRVLGVARSYRSPVTCGWALDGF